MAMYTKMTANGSSLMMAPRSISRDLEARISQSIEKIMKKHDISKLSTKFVRQEVEKDVHVSLTNHKEVLKRLMHQELRRLRSKKTPKRVVTAPWRQQERRNSIRSASRFIYSLLVSDQTHFNDYSLHAVQFFYDIQIVESGESQKICMMYARLLSAIWLKSDKLKNFQWDPESVPSPEQVVEMIRSVYALERVGMAQIYRSALLSFFDKNPPVYSALHYLGWNPALGPPSSSETDETIFDQMTQAILLTHFAHALDISIGCTMTQVFQYLPDFYPFKSHSEISNAAYRSQLHMITTAVMVVTNFGALRCEVELLPHELFYLKNQVPWLIVRQDVALLGEVLRALICFSGSDCKELICRGSAMLLASQTSNGSWRTLNENSIPETYHSTINALCALIEPKWTGFAPSDPEIAPLLELNVGAVVNFLARDKASILAKRKKLQSMQEDKLKEVETHRQDTPSDTLRVYEGRAASKLETMKMVRPDISARISNDPITSSDIPVPMEDIAAQVNALQGMLTDSGDIRKVSVTLALHVLKTLSDMKLDVDTLKCTGVGRVIGKLKKHSDDEVSKASQILIKKWKKSIFEA